MTRRLPLPLKPGDRVAIVSPASPFDRDEFHAGLAELTRLGFVPVHDETVFASDAGYLSGSAELRAEAFMRYWVDPTVAALMAVRGGFGSVHLLPLLDREQIAARPKLFIAYSDNTSLLSWLTCQCGLTALHGPMLERRLARGAQGYDESSFLALLQGGRGLVLAPDGLLVLRGGEATGPLFGGTLTQLVASLGTPYAFDPPEGCILFIEDVNERPYRLDRMLTQLRLSGVMMRARALVFGEMRGCDEPQGAAPGRGSAGSSRRAATRPSGTHSDDVTARDVIDRLTRDFTGPVLFGFPSGHTSGPCWTIPLGVQVSVSTSPRPLMTVEEAPVA